ncbi:MAG: nitronate monooxygenase [Verrucomicrobia bacterium]|nr:nitronate monooxygenase [Verrucomicrobiota bacterium]
MWRENPIVNMCNVRFPLIQAPMPGVATPRLIASVCNAGGLGSLGAAYMSAKEIKEAIREIRDLTEQPFGVNLFAPQPILKDPIQILPAQNFLDRYRQELGIPSALPDFNEIPSFLEQIETILLERPPVFSFTLGIPPLPILQRLKKEKIFLMGTATTLEEAQLLEMSGVDAVIAQGAEAGGHRGAFIDPQADPMLGLSTLVPLLVRSLKAPVIASGGIMNGDGIAAALAYGAAAVQMGTAFIACPESGAARPYKEALLHPRGALTQVTHVYSGRPARMIRNKFIKEMAEEEAPVAPFPYQHYLTKDIRTAASKMNRADLLSLYAGQNYPLITNLPASEIIPLLIEQTVIAIEKLSMQINESQAKHKDKHD